MGLFDEKSKDSKEEQIGNLGDFAARRKAKLLELKKTKKRKHGDDEDENNEEQNKSNEELQSPQVLFRTYQPQTDDLKEVVLPKTQPVEIENLVQEQLENANKPKDIDIEITNLAPKKITFDLQRGIQQLLDQADRRTDKAIAELIRERLKEGRQQDFLFAVNDGAKAQKNAAMNSDDDDDD